MSDYGDIRPSWTHGNPRRRASKQRGVLGKIPPEFQPGRPLFPKQDGRTGKYRHFFRPGRAFSGTRVGQFRLLPRPRCRSGAEFWAKHPQNFTPDNNFFRDKAVETENIGTFSVQDAPFLVRHLGTFALLFPRSRPRRRLEAAQFLPGMVFRVGCASFPSPTPNRIQEPPGQFQGGYFRDVGVWTGGFGRRFCQIGDISGADGG